MPQSWNLPAIEKYPAKKVRKWNKVAERQLESVLSGIDQKRNSHSEKMEQSIRNVKRQLDHYDHEKQMTDFRAVLRISAPHSGSVSGRTSSTPDSIRNFGTRSFSCVYTGTKRINRCPHFPCNKPSSYHTIGYRIDPENTEWIPWLKLRNNLRDSALSAIQKSVLLNTGVSRLRAERREAILKIEMEKRRKKQEKEKPPSWEVNYGKPTSIRRLKYPVRLEPISA